jgi:uncharacterized protein (UPF0128 family)
MARTKMVNGEVIPFTPEEEVARDAEEAQAVADKDARELLKAAKQERLDSVRSKLEALGLTTEEVKDAFGL